MANGVECNGSMANGWCGRGRDAAPKLPPACCFADARCVREVQMLCTTPASSSSRPQPSSHPHLLCSRPSSLPVAMSSKPSIPSWQRAQAADADAGATARATDADAPPDTPSDTHDPRPAPTSDEQPPDTPSHTEPDQASLLSRASTFLDDPAIRHAPREKKIEFLQAKGLHDDAIASLLPTEPTHNAGPDLVVAAAERAWSASTSHKKPQPQPQPRDIPPIVTYPEFLAQPTQQPPLITTGRLINTAYITGAIAATVYGFSKYIIAPMTHNLTESRHDFAAHAQSQLDQLNERLRDAASVDPATKAKPSASDVPDDVSEADSDPTELFHRDFGTQTTPTLSRRDSKSSGSAQDDETLVRAHESRLNILTSHLRELEATRSKDTSSSDALKTQLSNLQTYLSDMSYQNQYYPSSGGFYATTYGLPKSKDDQIEVLKGDIRAVKGVFLSARNFPSGRAGAS